MSFTSSDWTISYSAKTVTNDDSGTGNNIPSVYGDKTYVGPILEFFQWLATEFAATAQMDDDYAIVSDTPTVYRWLNGWTFGHADDFKYLEGGSIVDPSGSGTATADSLWANLYSIGTQETGTQLYLIQDDAEVTPWWITGNIDILVLVKDTGVWVQSDNVSGTPTNGGVWIFAREFGDLYDHNFSDLSGGGRNPIGINTAPDSGNKSGELYVTVTGSSGTWTVGNFLSDDVTGATGRIISVDSNDIYLNAVRGGTLGTNACTEYTDRELQSAGDATATISSTTNVVAGYSDITDTFGTISRDLNNGDGFNNYDVEINCAGRVMTQAYEWLKYLVRYGSTGGTYTVNGDNGQEYRSADEGTYTDVKSAPFGTLAGTTFYGARGVWVTNYSVADFVLIDADGDEQAPPNYQKVIVSHADLTGAILSGGSVTIFVAELTAGNVYKDRYTVASATSDSLVATTAIDINKTPQTGKLRVGDVRYSYTGFNDTAFSGVSPDPSSATGAFYVPLLDLTAGEVTTLTVQSDNIIYSSNIDVRTVVRRYGTKPYTADTTFTVTGLSFSPILTDDPQAT